MPENLQMIEPEKNLSIDDFINFENSQYEKVLEKLKESMNVAIPFNAFGLVRGKCLYTNLKNLNSTA